MGQLKLDKVFNAVSTERVGIMGAGVPVIIPSSGTVATNGTITLTTALPTVYTDAWIYLPAGAIVGGAAGLYYAEFSSTTVGVVTTYFVNASTTTFAPYDPVDETEVVAVGSNSAYTQTIAADLTLSNVIIPGGLMGSTGQLVVKTLLSTPSNANAKTPKITFGSTEIHNAAITTSLVNNIDKDLTNRGKATRQVCTPLAALGHGASATAAVYGTENTKDDVSLKFTGRLAVATDYMVLEYAIVEVFAS